MRGASAATSARSLLSLALLTVDKLMPVEKFSDGKGGKPFWKVNGTCNPIDLGLLIAAGKLGAHP
jgi:hypothetical protein